ncbi:hypothetical protein K1W69_23250 [Hoeflea sp. WL0058]|uniref:Lipoprotein n=2 Tax=Flavimaribacter sediminis TaxID=2865987 RepID=A0AAE3D3S0_9HYPH|nr:hypothetical protein [Flavimaribacter sediminis]
MVSLQSVRGFALVSLMALVAGCNTSGNTGGAGAIDEKLGAKVVQGGCPSVQLRDGTAYIRRYARGGEDDPQKIVYQASITDTTRQCSITGSQMNITVVAAGHVAAGPAGGAGVVKMPIRVAVVENGTNNVIYSELTQFETSLPEGAPTAQFLFNDSNINIPISASRSVRVFVGFDEGPPKRS